MKEVELPEIGKLKLYKKRGNRNIRLSITRNGEVRVSMPTWVPYQAGIQFAKKRLDWITQNLPQKQRMLSSGLKIGKAHRLIIEQADVSRVSTRVQNGKIRITYPIDKYLTDDSVQSAADRASVKALKLESESLLPQRTAQLARQHDFTYKSVEIKKLASRWGSCSANKEITLNLYLMQLPWHLIDYVIIHELVHTKHLNHGADFWAKFESITPNAKKMRKELKNHQTIISPVSVD